MKSIAVISAKSTWLLNLAEMNPKGLRLFPFLTQTLTELYDFDGQPENAPADPSSSSQPGIKFKNGQFETSDGTVRVSLELYDDGIVAESAVSTEVSDKFIQHVINWAVTSVGLVFDPELVRSRHYVSEVVVQLNSRLKQVQPLLSFSELLSTHSLGGATQPLFSTGLLFGPENGPTSFSIEKRANTPIAANVFYSKATTSTFSHLKLLTEFDRILTSD